MKNHIIIQRWFFESRKGFLQESKEHLKKVCPGYFLPERNLEDEPMENRNFSENIAASSPSLELIHVSGLGRLWVVAARGCQQCEIFPDVHDVCLLFSLLTY